MSNELPAMDYPHAQRTAALGARLRRLSERIDREANQVYVALGLDFEQRWFGVLNQLTQHRSLSVGELAERLGVSHAAVSQTRASLDRRGLIETDTDPNDSRRALLRLSPAGQAFVAQLQPVWAALSEASTELALAAPGLIEALDRLETSLATEPLAARALRHVRTAAGRS